MSRSDRPRNPISSSGICLLIFDLIDSLPHKLSTNTRSLFCQFLPAVVSNLFLKTPFFSFLPKFVQSSFSLGIPTLFNSIPVRISNPTIGSTFTWYRIVSIHVCFLIICGEVPPVLPIACMITARGTPIAAVIGNNAFIWCTQDVG